MGALPHRVSPILKKPMEILKFFLFFFLFAFLVYFSDVLRDLSQRTKPVNTATFSATEVELLRTRGNRSAYKVWMGNWNPTEHPVPDAADTPRFRQFLRLKYIERKFYDPEAERTVDEYGGVGSVFANGKKTRIVSAPPQNSNTRRSWYEGITNRLRPSSSASQQARSLQYADNSRSERSSVSYSVAEVEDNASLGSNGTGDIPTLTWSAKVVDNVRKEDGAQAFVIDVATSLGGQHSVKRTYDEFFDFQCALLDHFPVEAGTTGQKRVIPYLPGKKVFMTARVLLERQKELNEYVQELSLLPEELRSWEKFQDFFCFGGS
ncbi:hypothetical protein, variant [Capsaspora owczarzaki ATCC 30864]|uniref:hypothetical protein, variant n=1 Tax=Capsaspora owczarzaki (strain ATCC 30864) TaxID=595528 RepID=UPI00035241BE|nr:hypothetical protein, variant [Capsaspora owczarzaki ATCC 30864]|eukprot:XP_011270367.1 hypothetical protein, variant [Capsaspora owczarzaki ATCC 30864]